MTGDAITVVVSVAAECPAEVVPETTPGCKFSESELAALLVLFDPPATTPGLSMGSDTFWRGMDPRDTTMSLIFNLFKGLLYALVESSKAEI